MISPEKQARERCHNCDRLVATDEEWESVPDGERDDLCWGFGANCENREVDWRSRALISEAERDTLKEALRKYGRHTYQCRLRAHPLLDCTCGLTAALSSPVAEEEGT